MRFFYVSTYLTLRGNPMYLIVASFVRNKREWLEVNLSDLKMSEVLTRYEEIHITLDMDGELLNWRPQHSIYYKTMYASAYTLQEWITHCNDNSINLDTTSTPFNFSSLERISSYSAYDIGFSVMRANGYINPDSEGNKVGLDLRLTRDNTDYSKFVGNVLISVNGIINPIVINDNGLYLKGGHTALHGGFIKDLNMINFQALGGYTIQNLPTMSQYRMDGGSVKTYENCCFNLNYDVTGKVFGIVIDGYLHLLDDVVEVIGNRQIRINWNKVPLLRRAIKAMGKTPYPSTVRNIELVNESHVTTNEWVQDIIASPFTYLLVFNRPDITKSITPLISKGLPGVYEYPHDLTGAVFSGEGEVWSYKKVRDRSTYDIAKEEHTLFNLPLDGAYSDAFATRLGGKTQYGANGTYVGGKGFEMAVAKMVQYHVLPENF